VCRVDGHRGGSPPCAASSDGDAAGATAYVSVVTAGGFIGLSMGVGGCGEYELSMSAASVSVSFHGRGATFAGLPPREAVG
jgi:hypothetical protein